ncbi:MAG: hypothetical protein H0T11_00110 [Chthoniobacterales bacterium]|nr:hypothetical protein [Chthoniobacterales bacterium]
MPHSKSKLTLDAARASLSHPLSFAEFLAKLSTKDRATAERRVSVLEALPDPSSANLWRRLACSLMTLAPFAAKLVGKQTLQIYVADGKYRKQVFALEDLQDGNFTMYCPDVLSDAAAAGLLTREARAEADEYVIEPSKEKLLVKQLDRESVNPAPHFKDMTGWNRKAIRITLPPSASPAQVEAAELLCALAAQHFVSTLSP